MARSVGVVRVGALGFRVQGFRVEGPTISISPKS